MHSTVKWGDSRADGFRFLAHRKATDGHLYEAWLSPESWAKHLLYRQRYMSAYQQTRVYDKEYNHQKYIRVRAHVLEQQKAIRRTPAGKAKKAIRDKLYRKNHRPEHNAHNSARRQITAAIYGANMKIIKQFYKWRSRVSQCTGILFHVDHVIPLSKGGIHHQDNLQVIPAIINLRKHASI